MYTGNRIIHFTWHAHGQSKYQHPVKESFVCGPPAAKQVKTRETSQDQRNKSRPAQSGYSTPENMVFNSDTKNKTPTNDT